MSIILRNDEQIQVGSTTGLVAGSSFFVFDGTGGKPDYKRFNLVVSEISGRSPMVKGQDFAFNTETGRFDLMQNGDVFQSNQWYNIHFEPLQQTVVVSPSNIVNESFFILDINIPLSDGNDVDRLNAFILEYEPQCLKFVLGFWLYKALISENSQRITDLIYGKDYVDCYGHLQNWEGLVHDANKSLIAYYIYFYFQRMNALQTMNNATTAVGSTGGVSVGPEDKMNFAWNKFSDSTQSMCSFLWTNIGVYPEFSNLLRLTVLNNTRKILGI